jgi:hypothetical protein
MARFTIASVAPSLAEFRKLPQHVQGRALLKALADRFPRGTFNRENLLLEPYNTMDPEGFALGLPEDERHDAVKYLFGSPWRFLINNGFIAVTNNDFYEITPEGHVEAADDIKAIRVDRTIVDALRFLHPDLQSYEHYFREGKLKEAVTAAFMRVENRLNEIRDASSSPAAKGVSGVSLPYKLFDMATIVPAESTFVILGNDACFDGSRAQVILCTDRCGAWNLTGRVVYSKGAARFLSLAPIRVYGLEHRMLSDLS